MDTGNFLTFLYTVDGQLVICYSLLEGKSNKGRFEIGIDLEISTLSSTDGERQQIERLQILFDIGVDEGKQIIKFFTDPETLVLTFETDCIELLP
jgi:hypothetical protein